MTCFSICNSDPAYDQYTCLESSVRKELEARIECMHWHHPYWFSRIFACWIKKYEYNNHFHIRLLNTSSKPICSDIENLTSK